MTRIEVFDPPMCCTTGVCGPEPDARLTRFAADLKSVADRGVDVRRYNLAQEPTAFSQNPDVTRVLAENDGDGLPVVVVDGRVVSHGEYPSRQRLLELAGLNGHAEAESQRQEAPRETVPVFDERVAELVALGAAIAANCELCFRYHHRKAVELGISNEDMIQAIDVALRVKDQPAQAMVRLARKHLLPDADQAGGCCGGGDGCC